MATRRKRAKPSRATCPSGKVRYRDRQRALHALRTIQGVERQRQVTPVRVYECPLCNGAHLTSMEQR